MTAGQTLAFVLFSVVAAITPGPSNLILTATGAAVGLLRGLPALAGQTIGMGFMLFVAGLGLGTVVLASPGLFGLLKWGGAGFLLWLAWKIATAGPGHGGVRPRPLGFWGAAAFQWVNPKAWLVAVAAVATFVHPASGGAFPQAVRLGLLFTLAALPSCFIWLAFGAGLQRLLQHERTAAAFNVAMGVLLAGTVLLIIR